MAGHLPCDCPNCVSLSTLKNSPPPAPYIFWVAMSMMHTPFARRREHRELGSAGYKDMRLARINMKQLLDSVTARTVLYRKEHGRAVVSVNRCRFTTRHPQGGDDLFQGDGNPLRGRRSNWIAPSRPTYLHHQHSPVKTRHPHAHDDPRIQQESSG